MTLVYLALGSNLDNPAEHLQTALEDISALPDSQVESISSIYQSPAVGPGEQPDYLNAVLGLSTTMSALQLLKAAQCIENKHGRVRKEHWGARTLDIDILLYGNDEIDTDDLQVPHPRMSQRNFVLYPLAEISDEQMLLPSMGVLESLLANCPRGQLAQTQISFTMQNEPK